MMRYSQVIRLRPECRDEYIELHKAVWPEVLATIAECSIRNYSIFLVDDLLMAYFEYEGQNYERDMAKMTACPDTQRWWKLTDAMQIAFDESSREKRWKQSDEVFHFSGR